MDFNRLSTSTLLAVLVLTGVGARAQSESTAVLHVVALQPGRAVHVDGRRVGVTPLFGLSLTAGQHQLSVSAPDSLIWTAQPWEASIRCPAGRATVVHAAVRHLLWVTSNPPGAVVWQNERRLGETPLRVEVQRHTATPLTLTKTGYIDFVLQPPQGRNQLHCEMQSALNRPVNGMRQPVVNKTRGLTGGALSFLLGAAGYWMKTRADDAYEHYLHTGHPTRMARYFKDAQSYDRWSSALYMAGEATLGLTLYLTLKDFWQ